MEWSCGFFKCAYNVLFILILDYMINSLKMLYILYMLYML